MLNKQIQVLTSSVNALNHNQEVLQTEIYTLKDTIEKKDNELAISTLRHNRWLSELEEHRNNCNRIIFQRSNKTKKFDELLASLKEHLQCPIILETFKNPVLTPSGNTVESSVMENLIKNRKLDPFSRKGTCKEIFPNLLVRQISELYAKFSC